MNRTVLGDASRDLVPGRAERLDLLDVIIFAFPFLTLRFGS